MSELALKLIAENKEAHARGDESAKRLDIGNCGLTELPEELFDCVWLKKLIVSNKQSEDGDLLNSENLVTRNVIGTIPKKIERLVNLTELKIGGDFNSQWSISDIGALSALTKLESLDLSYNQVHDILALKESTKLKFLNVRYNQINEIDFTGFNWPSIELLNLSATNITKILRPDSIRNLKTLIFEANQIEDISFLASFSDLECLKLSANKISDISSLNLLTGLLSLDISTNRITNIRPLKNLVKLKTLYLGSNRISDISIISGLIALTNIDLNNNRIYDISCFSDHAYISNLNLNYNEIKDADIFISMKELQSLYLRRNSITDIKFLKNLTKLKCLDLGENKIADIYPIAYLNALTTLLLGNNDIQDISYLSAIENVEELDLSSNKIENIRFVSNLNNLRILNISNNNIIHFGFLSQLKKLQILDISSSEINDIRFLSTLNNLRLLNLKNNQISYLPKNFIENIHLNYDISNQNNLMTGVVYLSGNPLKHPPTEVIQQGRDFTLEYINSSNKKSLNECKVIIIGQGGVGKTSLQKRLTRHRFDPNEPETHGIRKVSWDDGIKSINWESIVVHFWDFGGQHIQQALHQFFYSKDTIYILVLDKRKDEDPEDFMELVRTYGHESPVFIVFNNHISRNGDYELVPELDSALLNKYRNIQGVFGVSCGIENDEGVNLLRRSLQEFIPHLSHVRQEFPADWLEIKNELLNQVGKNYLVYNEYQTICQNKNLEEEKTQKSLAEMLSTVGTITFFDRPFGDNYYILNPDWLTTGAYQIILSHETKSKHGRINRQDINKIFLEKQLFHYKSQDIMILLNLMAAFDLCHKFIETEEWIIPSSLETKSKMDLNKFTTKNCRQYRFKYSVSLPPSVIHRFIVRNINFAFDEDYWKNGIVVKHPNSDSFMYVLADAKDKEIRLWVKGERIRDCWEFFRKDLKELSHQFEYEELVVLDSGESVKYQLLLDASLKGKKEIFIGGRTGDVDVEETLGLFETPRRGGPNPPINPRRKEVKIFISYSHKDESVFNELNKYLTNLRRSGKVEVWHDRQIKPGDEWNENIKKELITADIVLLMITADFNSSDFIWTEELSIAMDRHDKGLARVIPISLKNCDWDDMPYAKLQALPKDAQPISNYEKPETAYTEIAKGIRKVLEDMTS